MLPSSSTLAIIIFMAFAGLVLGISFWLGRKAKSAAGYFAAHGEVHWFVNGIAFAGDYLSAASFLGICGMIAFFGYDGFLYAIGYLAGWLVALFVVAEPLRKLGKFTFADALDAKFGSRSIKTTAALSTLIVSLFYLIPQMVGAGVLVKPLLGLPQEAGVIIVGFLVIAIVTTAGMVSTTWVQFIKGTMLVVFCTILVAMILARGFTEKPGDYQRIDAAAFAALPGERLAVDKVWSDKQLSRIRLADGRVQTWKEVAGGYVLCQTLNKKAKLVDGLPQTPANDLKQVGSVLDLPGDSKEARNLSPSEFLSTLQDSTVLTWPETMIKDPKEGDVFVYAPTPRKGEELLTPGGSSTFKALKGDEFTWGKLDFISLMLALFCGTASLPHILIRYYTVKDASAVRKSTVVGIAAIGFFYILTLFLGLGAMASGAMDPSSNNMSAPLLARSYGEWPFALVCAIAFTTVLGTVAGLILAASGAVAHDIMAGLLGHDLDEAAKVKAGKIAAVVVGILAMGLGILFKDMNVNFLVGWAFNVAASANLPALLMILFWKGTTKQGVAASISVGLISSIGWILCSEQACKDVYKLADPANAALVPFSQPAILTIPLAFLTLVLVSLATRKKTI
ncbi:MAG: hypothetical protein RL095_880 [Verrucomicrobiota bacterium]|jgi:cation/acetate symporter